MKLQKLKTETLITASYNPKIRTDKKELKDLLTSIKANGILYPLMVDNKTNLIDGHRRLACAKILKMQTIPCFISDSTLNKDECYETINTTARKMMPNEMIYVHTRGGAIPKKAQNKMKQLEAIMGTADLKVLGNKYISLHVLSQGKQIGKYCNDKTPVFIKKSILWIVKNKQSYQIRKAIEDGISKATLKKAVISDRPLKRDWK